MLSHGPHKPLQAVELLLQAAECADICTHICLQCMWFKNNYNLHNYYHTFISYLENHDINDVVTKWMLQEVRSFTSHTSNARTTTSAIYLSGRSNLEKHRLLRRPIWLRVVWATATEGPPVLLREIDAPLRLVDDEEWPKECRESLQG